jgi:hypothetical protein
MVANMDRRDQSHATAVLVPWPVPRFSMAKQAVQAQAFFSFS